ncbi:hypothetical protein O7606_03820 [Micromonospora sp. WMMD882]|uniref:MauE/DoxX family redox-associated membrane protein n=1 Tax=Micromonospora sp. WMMD882 TaxID=3015151 RepID=UPI00248D2918|nr:MauE/DoxX family redox-associated membrane protein [Micromonospora sp. WMMD882]WBB80525.1 hypothetical protein O7606_03820 [Micromonospora sp. WMMD882]
MPVSALLASVAAYTVTLTLLVATAEHLSRPAALPRALAAHRVLPAPTLTAAVVVTAEALLAGAGVVALATDDPRPRVAVGLAGAALFGLYAGYGRHLVRTGRAGPCGCSRLELPTSGWVVARAGILAGLALVGAVRPGSIVGWPTPDADLAVVLLAAATFTALLWHLPAAMRQPAGPARLTEGELPG